MNKTFINVDWYHGLVANICRDITNSGWRPDYIVGITRGGLYPAVLISHYFNIRMHALGVSLRDSQDCESNLWMAEDAFGYDFTLETEESNQLMKKNILIVDDINDSGATLNWIVEDWQKNCYPHGNWQDIWNQNVRFAVVVDNTKSNAKVKIDYCGLEVAKEDDDWIVFPYENWWE